uniref:Lipoprotein n=1 Tax=Parastrongyloides trichosuri TaxID=131310 RepID=A0A0N4ZXP2_PARTI
MFTTGALLLGACGEKADARTAPVPDPAVATEGAPYVLTGTQPARRLRGQPRPPLSHALCHRRGLRLPHHPPDRQAGESGRTGRAGVHLGRPVLRRRRQGGRKPSPRLHADAQRPAQLRRRRAWRRRGLSDLSEDPGPALHREDVPRRPGAPRPAGPLLRRLAGRPDPVQRPGDVPVLRPGQSLALVRQGLYDGGRGRLRPQPSRSERSGLHVCGRSREARPDAPQQRGRHGRRHADAAPQPGIARLSRPESQLRGAGGRGPPDRRPRRLHPRSRGRASRALRPPLKSRAPIRRFAQRRRDRYIPHHGRPGHRVSGRGPRRRRRQARLPGTGAPPRSGAERAPERRGLVRREAVGQPLQRSRRRTGRELHRRADGGDDRPPGEDRRRRRLGHRQPHRPGHGRPALPARRLGSHQPVRWREAPRGPVPPAAVEARHAAARRTDQPPGRRIRRLAAAPPGELPRLRHLGDPRPLLPGSGDEVDAGVGPRQGPPARGQLFLVAGSQDQACRAGTV